jgi:phage/plasmid primase-like uncharacterized protein
MLDFNVRSEKIDNDSPVESIGKAMAEHGLDPGEIIADGTLHRFDVAKRNDKAGWYVMYCDGDCPAGSFGNWQTGLTETWCSISDGKMSSDQIEEFKRHVAEMKEKRKTEERRLQSDAKAIAEDIWNNAKPADDSHPYLTSKNVGPHGIKTDGSRLIVPLFDINNDIHSIQYINNKGRKLFLEFGAIKGNFFTINGDKNVYICEGFATGATINEITGGTVIVAFNSGNLSSVASNIKTKFPSSQITICADNDQFTATSSGKQNPGVLKAKEAAELINASVIIPEFKKPEKGKTDFNDLLEAEGPEAVRIQILGCQTRFKLSDWCIDAYHGSAPERRWLVYKTFPMASVAILAAMGDAGKGMLSLDLALKVAADPGSGELDFGYGAGEAFGNQVMESGSVIIFSAEDDKDEIHRRIEQIDTDGKRFGDKCSKRLMIIPLPNAGGPIQLVSPGRHGPTATPIFHEIKDQLLKVNDLKLVVFDPLASFVSADINADPAVGAYTTGLLASLAIDTGACVIVAHHMGKSGGNTVIRTPEQARALIRGTTAIVDGVRSTYVLWPMESKYARQKCSLLKTTYQRNKVFSGALVKANGPGDRELKTFVRNDAGLLVVENGKLDSMAYTKSDLLSAIAIEIQNKAEVGQPYTLSGSNGMFERSEEMIPQLRGLSKHAIQNLAKELLDEGTIVKCTAKGSKAKVWLDVPNGKFACGYGEFAVGAVKQSYEE